MTVPLYSGTVPNPVQQQPEFDTNTQEFIDYIANLAPALNDFATTINSADTTSTSTTSVAIGTGSKTFSVEPGKSYVLGMSLKIANTVTNYMVGDVISYNLSTGALVVNVVATSGTGTYASWTISLGFGGIIDTVQGGTGLTDPGPSGNLLTSNGTTWTSAAPPSGGQYLGTATVKAIAYNAQSIAENITVGSTQNGLSAGPITIDSTYTVTVDSGGTWVIV